MSTIGDAFGDPDEGPRARTLARVAHTALPVIVGTLAIRAVNWFGEIPYWLDTTTTLVLIWVVVLATIHQAIARICVRCMERVPADAPVRAQRQRWALWLVHFARRSIWVWFGVWMILILLYYLAESLLYPGLPANSPQDNWLLAPGDVLFAAYAYGLVMHHRLSPWCPYCRWGEGGTHEQAPTPTPDPTGVKTR